MSSPGTPEGRTIMESKFERIIVTADVWRKRNITASKHEKNKTLLAASDYTVQDESI